MSSADRTKFFFETSQDDAEGKKAGAEPDHGDDDGMDPTDVEALR